MTHTLDIYEDYAHDIADGSRPFEIREKDRDFKRGEHIIFKVLPRNKYKDVSDHELNKKEYEITSVYEGWYVKTGSVLLGLKEIKKEGGSS